MLVFAITGIQALPMLTQRWLNKQLRHLIDIRPSQVAIYTDQSSSGYAKRIHDEKGASWHNRGPGTRAKGSDADDKFIKRAIDDSEPTTLRELEKAIRIGITGKNPWPSTLTQVGLRVQGLAREYAPRSMSKAQYKRTLKTKRGRKNSKALLQPGTLERSIQIEVS